MKLTVIQDDQQRGQEVTHTLHISNLQVLPDVTAQSNGGQAFLIHTLPLGQECMGGIYENCLVDGRCRKKNSFRTDKGTERLWSDETADFLFFLGGGVCLLVQKWYGRIIGKSSWLAQNKSLRT